MITKLPAMIPKNRHEKSNSSTGLHVKFFFKKKLNNFCGFIHVCIVMDFFCNNEIKSSARKRRYALHVKYLYFPPF